MTAPPGSLSDRDKASHLHPFTQLRHHLQRPALVIERGDGIHVIDETGRRYIDGLSGLWCASLGFSERRLAQAAYRQMLELPFNHTFRGRTHRVTIELAERLLAMAPSPMSKVFFACSGSEANDTAIKLAWHHHRALGRPHRRKLIVRRGAYHGTTVATTCLSGVPDPHPDAHVPLPGVLHVEKPHHYRGGRDGESEAEYARRLVDDLESLILAEGPDTIAAFFAEPVMGVGGVIVPPEGYFEGVQRVLAKHDILLVADEIVCGFGRTGDPWGSRTFGLEPDLLVCAKSLSAAYLPISAVLVSGRVFDALLVESDRLGLFGHGFTYSGHPVPAAVALETLRIYEERDLVAHARQVGERLQQGLRRLAAASPIVGEARGVGLMAGLELVRDRATRAPFDAALGAGTMLAERALERDLIVRPLGDTVAMAPPLVITAAEVDELLQRFAAALDATQAELLARA